MAPILWGSCVSSSLLQTPAGGINALKPARCLGGSVMVEEREMKLIYSLRLLKLHAYVRGHKGSLNL